MMLIISDRWIFHERKGADPTNTRPICTLRLGVRLDSAFTSCMRRSRLAQPSTVGALRHRSPLLCDLGQRSIYAVSASARHDSRIPSVLCSLTSMFAVADPMAPYTRLACILLAVDQHDDIREREREQFLLGEVPLSGRPVRLEVNLRTSVSEASRQDESSSWDAHFAPVWTLKRCAQQRF